MSSGSDKSRIFLQDNGPAVAFALAGGLALGIGNILMQYSLAFVGISLTEVVSASLAVVGGKSSAQGISR